MSSASADTWRWKSFVPSEKVEGGEADKDGAAENATGWGVDGDVLNGTAAGCTGEENTGGPGGVLKCGSGLPVLIPFADKGKGGPLLEGECIWLGCMVGGVNLGPVGGVKGGGLNLVSGLRDCCSGVEGVIPTGNPAEKLGWSAIIAHMRT